MRSSEFYGETFELSDEPVSDWVMLELAASGDSDDPSAAAKAVMLALSEVVAESDWARFKAHARTSRASVDSLGQFIVDNISARVSAVDGRPTVPSSDFSDGRPSTEPRSVGDSFSPVIARLEDRGRPDLAIAVQRRRDSLASA